MLTVKERPLVKFFQYTGIFSVSRGPPTILQLKSKKKRKHLKVHPLNFEKAFMELKGKLGQSLVKGLLNNSLSVNPLPLPDIMEIDSLKGKMF